MDGAEAAKWRRRIGAWCRFRRIVPPVETCRIPTPLLEDPDLTA